MSNKTVFEEFPYMLRTASGEIWFRTEDERTYWIKALTAENLNADYTVANGDVAHTYATLICDIEYNSVLYRQEVRLSYGYTSFQVEQIAMHNWKPERAFCEKHGCEESEIKVWGKRVTYIK